MLNNLGGRVHLPFISVLSYSFGENALLGPVWRWWVGEGGRVGVGGRFSWDRQSHLSNISSILVRK